MRPVTRGPRASPCVCGDRRLKVKEGIRGAVLGPPLVLLSDRAGLARRLLRVVELALDQVEPRVPEAGVGQVDADDAAELLGRQRPAGAQHLDVARDEALALVDVALVD